jgi:hypothetical protein
MTASGPKTRAKNKTSSHSTTVAPNQEKITNARVLLRANDVRGVQTCTDEIGDFRAIDGNSILDVIIGNVLAYRPESVKSCESPSNPLNPLIRCGALVEPQLDFRYIF